MTLGRLAPDLRSTFSQGTPGTAGSPTVTPFPNFRVPVPFKLESSPWSLAQLIGKQKLQLQEGRDPPNALICLVPLHAPLARLPAI